jgi:hypothetical protein
LWRDAFAPIAVGKKPQAWLVLRPQTLALMQPLIKDGRLTLALTLSARGEVKVQENAPLNPPTALPKALPLDQASNRFWVNVPFLLPYAEAERLARDSLNRHPPAIAGVTLKISEVHILPSFGDVAVETRFCADPNWDIGGLFASCAHVYFIGQPEFDSATATFKITHLRYDVASAGLMLHLFQGVFAPTLVARLIEQHLVFDEQANIARLKRDVRQELAKPRGKILSISADLRAFGAASFSWTRDGFLVFFPAMGKVNTIIKA